MGQARSGAAAVRTARRRGGAGAAREVPASRTAKRQSAPSSDRRPCRASCEPARTSLWAAVGVNRPLCAHSLQQQPAACLPSAKRRQGPMHPCTQAPCSAAPAPDQSPGPPGPTTPPHPARGAAQAAKSREAEAGSYFHWSNGSDQYPGYDLARVAGLGRAAGRRPRPGPAETRITLAASAAAPRHWYLKGPESGAFLQKCRWLPGLANPGGLYGARRACRVRRGGAVRPHGTAREGAKPVEAAVRQGRTRATRAAARFR